MIFLNTRQYKANLHSHSTISDGKLTPEQMKKAYKDKGYSVLAITDHERPFDHSAMTENDFVMITGYEAYIRPSENAQYDAYTRELHINLLAKDAHNIDLIGWNDCYVKYEKDPVKKAAMPRYGTQEQRKYTHEYINKFIQTAKEDGYLVTLNHPVWSLEDFDWIYDLKGFFSMEICNYGCYCAGFPEYNGALYDMLLRRGERIFAHSADDNHNKYPLDAPGCDSFGGFTMIATEDGTLSYEKIIKALECGSFYSSMGPTVEFVEIKDGKARIKCSNVKRITMLFGAKSARNLYPETADGFVNEAEFDIPDEAKFVRFSIVDECGRFADTRGYFRDEWK